MRTYRASEIIEAVINTGRFTNTSAISWIDKINSLNKNYKLLYNLSADGNDCYYTKVIKLNNQDSTAHYDYITPGLTTDIPGDYSMTPDSKAYHLPSDFYLLGSVYWDRIRPLKRLSSPYDINEGYYLLNDTIIIKGREANNKDLILTYIPFPPSLTFPSPEINLPPTPYAIDSTLGLILSSEGVYNYETGETLYTQSITKPYIPQFLGRLYIQGNTIYSISGIVKRTVDPPDEFSNKIYFYDYDTCMSLANNHLWIEGFTWPDGSNYYDLRSEAASEAEYTFAGRWFNKEIILYSPQRGFDILDPKELSFSTASGLWSGGPYNVIDIHGELGELIDDPANISIVPSNNNKRDLTLFINNPGKDPIIISGKYPTFTNFNNYQDVNIRAASDNQNTGYGLIVYDYSISGYKLVSNLEDTLLDVPYNLFYEILIPLMVNDFTIQLQVDRPLIDVTSLMENFKRTISNDSFMPITIRNDNPWIGAPNGWTC